MRICRIKFISKPQFWCKEGQPFTETDLILLWGMKPGKFDWFYTFKKVAAIKNCHHLVFWWRCILVGCEAGQEDSKILKMVILIPGYQFGSLMSASNLSVCHGHFLSRNDQSQAPNQIYLAIIVLMHHLGIAWPAIMSPIPQLCSIEYSKTSMKYWKFCCCIFQMEKRPVLLKFTGSN